MRLEQPTRGHITVDGLRSTVRGIKGQEYLHLVQMVYQDPFASLNPFHTIGHHIERPLRIHGKGRRFFPVERTKPPIAAAFGIQLHIS